jgi:hypothetical protein
MWVRSYFRYDHVEWRRSDGVYGAGAFPGVMFVGYHRPPGDNELPGWSYVSSPVSELLDVGDTPAPWSTFGVTLYAESLQIDPSIQMHLWAVQARYFWLFVATALIPFVRTFAWLGARRRRRVLLCPSCGYDLRATPDQCPECGAVPAKASS